MAVYGVMLHWDAHTTVNDEDVPEDEFYFVSTDAKSYLEVSVFPRIQDEEGAEWIENDINEKVNGTTNEDGSRTLRMTFARRAFSMFEQDPNQTVTFDGRLWPPVTEKPDGSRPPHIEAGLPADVSYPDLGLGNEKVRAA